MSQKNLIIFVIVSLLALLLSNGFKNSSYEDYIQKKRDLVAFEKEAREIAGLKKRFSDKKSAKRLIETLKRVAMPSSEKSRASSVVYEFENLNSRKLNTILRKIENSGIKIKELKIKRVEPNKATVRVEVFK